MISKREQVTMAEQDPHGMLPVEKGSWIKRKFFAVLGSDTLINLNIIIALAIGFFHGWLKLKIRHPITTFLFDIFLVIGLLLMFFRRSKGEPLFPEGPISDKLKLFYGLCFVYLIPGMVVPGFPPLLLAVVAIRSWCFATFTYHLGYYVTRNFAQIRNYFYWVILLGIITAVYGLRQSPEEIERMMEEDAYMAQRYQYQHYVDDEGERRLRIFSTFISSGAFGMTMAFTAIFALVFFLDSNLSKMERGILGLCSFPMLYAMLMSGSRSPVLIFGLGLAIIAWFRRQWKLVGIGAGVLVLSILVASLASDGGIVSRLSTLADARTIWGRFFIPTWIGWNYSVSEGNFLGGGLGKTGFLPMFLVGRSGYYQFVKSDGDLGRLMIELGIFGVIIFSLVIWTCLKQGAIYVRNLRGTPSEAVGLAAFTSFGMSVISFPTGSPYVQIPVGILVWFFLGTLHRLNDLEVARQNLPAKSREAGIPVLAGEGDVRKPKFLLNQAAKPHFALPEREKERPKPKFLLKRKP